MDDCILGHCFNLILGDTYLRQGGRDTKISVHLPNLFYQHLRFEVIDGRVAFADVVVDNLIATVICQSVVLQNGRKKDGVGNTVGNMEVSAYRMAHGMYVADVYKRQILEMVERRSAISYDEVQLEAVRMAISSKVMVLTGGPGTGKTTTTMGIITAYQLAGCQILLAAPTGRAAKRMSEATGMEAKTIHRLLEYKPPEGYQKNEEHPLEGDVLILDECSMVDVMLMYNLLKALPEHMSLILVGDTDQLPSVGAGNVLKDIIDSGRVPVVRLTRIFRQAQGSRIIMNAHRINQGEPCLLYTSRCV